MFLDRYRESVMDALDKEMITEAEIEQAIRGPLRVMLKLGLMDNGDNPYAKIGIEDTLKPWTKPEAHALARKATARSVVLLKNEGLLPLSKQKLKSIAVIGPSADLVVSDWYSGTPPYAVSVVDGIRNMLSKDVDIRFAASNKADSAVLAARGADVAVVCIGNHPLSYGLGWGQNHVPSDGREEVDRQAITLEQEDLIRLVMAENPNTVLVLVSSFPYAINWSKAHVPAILQVTQSSQELGNGLADVIFGDTSPAGRLVQTWSSSIGELLPILDYNIRHGRTYMYDPHQPLFAFGHGLSYTSFEYSDLKLPNATIRDGEVIDLSLKVTNTGPVDSDEVIQLYVRFPGSIVERPLKALKGFQRVHIRAGEDSIVHIPLKAEDLKYWDISEHAFTLEEGTVELMVGASSEDIRLTGTVKVR